ncbi:uncharacterized protein LOC133805842 [Humulus lupulus]|uniref:uncharacterized protein LOC133805842 n=1 Tax=Humulus lupulus TaxID=3486 RepID=UPI002B411DA2|nr:uncharacterized protein LOC133805842 [Humulus lupulus]
MANNKREDIKNDYGIELSYGKAWRCREKALSYVRGTLEASYQKLPSYLFMLQQKNPGTLTDFVTEEDRFKYCFFSLGVIALDANNHLYPVAFGIVDNENHDSWKYFMSKLKEAIGEVEDLAFVSDRHVSITHALETIFPDAYHGNLSSTLTFEKIKSKYPAIAQYLEGIGFDKWSHAYFPGNRYNIMTRNYAESFNNKTRDARSFPITTFVEFIRFTLQSWFCDRRETSKKITTTLAPTYEKNLIIGIPCDHALSGSLKRGVNFYSLCSDYYKIETWKSSYTESIYPTGKEEEWIVPHDIMTIKVRTPAQKNPVGLPKKKQGRPKKKRHPSNGDKLVVERKCNTCGGLGHNRATCKVRV